MTVLLAIVAAGGLARRAWAQQQAGAILSPDGQPLSARVSAYSISAKLDTAAKTLDATETLEYRNLSDQPLSSFPFHLYLNAFRPQSTFSREARVDTSLGAEQVPDSREKMGAIEISSISADGYGDLLPTLHFTAPDDGNTDDHTVMEVSLPKPLASGETVRFHIAFHDKLPLSAARTGYKRGFFMGAQWFPKIGVFWHGAWNCHQYHATTEFFSDFATYNVELTLPRRFIVGASGVATGETPHADGTKTVSFLGEDIHDFAWAASPDFLSSEDSFRNSLGTVKLQILTLRSHANQQARYVAALKGAMQKFDEWYGPYPYKQITLIDPEPDSEFGGMEYPTLITAGLEWWSPPWYYYGLEATVIHEFGHQYWYGMVATNEFEQPWLDEGINSYSESKAMESLYGRNTSLINARTIHLSDTEAHRLAYITNPDYDPIARNGWNFLDSWSYAATAYGKTSTVLATLESLVGEYTVRKSMRLYFQRYRFTHPTGADFLQTVSEVSGRSDLEPFFTQAIYGTQILDYSIASVDSQQEKPGTGPYRTSVVVHRGGDFVFPVTLEVRFADGSKQRATWDGSDRWKRFTWDETSEAVSAQIDPDHVVPLDASYFNNSYTLEAHPGARLKLTNYWVFAQQLLSQWLSFLV